MGPRAGAQATETDLDIAVSIADERWLQALPEASARCRRAVAAALEVAGLGGVGEFEVSVLLADDERVRTLNRRYRGVDEATNVLSFPTIECAPDAPPRAIPGVPLPLGDVALALETAEVEAAGLGKPLADHVSHLVVHGVLHLVGYDHGNEAEARAMEKLEAAALAGLGVPDPYRQAPAQGLSGLRRSGHTMHSDERERSV